MKKLPGTKIKLYLYIFIILITVALVFSVSAICNMCAATEPTDTTNSSETTTIPLVTTTTATDTTAPTTSGEPQAPEIIELDVFIGPEYNEESGFCFYRIEAIATGNPLPDIIFSRDDSDGAWGNNICQVNIEDPADTYTLTVTATNTEGEDVTTLDLAWGCDGTEPEEPENQNPLISEITLMGTKYTNIEYTISASASDPDGDSLSYNWSVSGGTIDDNTANPVKWTTPSEPGTCNISVTVSDGNGGEASADRDVDIHFLYDLLVEAPDAYWVADGPIDFGGPIDDPRGFVLYRTDIELEDGIIYSKVLETHPRWIDGGIIHGISTRNITIPDGARFTAKVGFIKGATATDGTQFTIRFWKEGIAHYTSDPLDAFYDGVLDDLNLDLGPLSGMTGQIQLIVYAKATSAQDWAVWVNPKITN